MKILIVDDEKNARLALRGMIETNFSEHEIIDEAESIPDAVKAIHKHQPDVVLLDIEMPNYLGIDLLDFFDTKEITFKIIFITAYNDYAVQAFELAAVDYLLKPTRIEQLKRAFDRVLQHTNNENYKALKENLDKQILSKIAFTTAKGLIIEPIENIIFLKADGSYTHIHLGDGTRITVTKRLQDYNTLNDTGRFLRVNRSYIINLYQITKISKRNDGFVTMSNGEEISISPENREKLYVFFKDTIF